MKIKTFHILICLFVITIFDHHYSAATDDSNKDKKYTLIEHKIAKKIKDEFFFDRDNKSHNLEEYENQTIILHFWATWCTFCTNKMRSLDEFQKLSKNENLKIIPLSQDFKGIEVIEQFYQKKNIKNLEIFIDKKNKLFKNFNIIALPTTVIINFQGNEVARILGSVDWQQDEEIKKLITKYTIKKKSP